MSLSSFTMVILASLAIFLVVGILMAIGVIFGRRPISGSCGGLASREDADGKTSCSLCENPAEACREIRRRQQAAGQR